MTVSDTFFWKALLVAFVLGTANQRLAQIETRLGDIEARIATMSVAQSMPRQSHEFALRDLRLPTIFSR